MLVPLEVNAYHVAELVILTEVSHEESYVEYSLFRVKRGIPQSAFLFVGEHDIAWKSDGIAGRVEGSRQSRGLDLREVVVSESAQV